MTRLASRLAALLAVVLVLTGCRLDVAVRVDVAKDGSGTVTVTATADQELLTRAPSVLGELQLGDARSAGWTVRGPTRTTPGGAVVVLTKRFSTPGQATAILAEINGARGPLHGMTVTQEHAFARVETSVRGTIRVDGGVAALSDDALAKLLSPAGMAAALGTGSTPLDQTFGFTFSALAPGSVTSTNGAAVPGGAVTWKASVRDGRVTPVAAAFEQRDTAAERARTVETWTTRGIVIWVVVFALIALVTVLVLRRRRHRQGAHPGTR
jgi:hypothetical protein